MEVITVRITDLTTVTVIIDRITTAFPTPTIIPILDLRFTTKEEPIIVRLHGLLEMPELIPIPEVRVQQLEPPRVLLLPIPGEHAVQPQRKTRREERLPVVRQLPAEANPSAILRELTQVETGVQQQERLPRLRVEVPLPLHKIEVVYPPEGLLQRKREAVPQREILLPPFKAVLEVVPI